MSDYDEAVGCYDAMADHAIKKIMREIAEQREEIIRAFVAKYGLDPEECEQIINMDRYVEGVITWSIRRKEKKNESTN